MSVLHKSFQSLSCAVISITNNHFVTNKVLSKVTAYQEDNSASEELKMKYETWCEDNNKKANITCEQYFYRTSFIFAIKLPVKLCKMCEHI